MNDESAITISLEGLILEAMLGNDEALAVLLWHDSLLKLVEDISRRAARLYNEDEDAIQQRLRDVVKTKIRKLKKPGCIKSWLKKAARNYCFNTKRHRKVERFHFGQVARTAANEEYCETEPLVDSDTVPTPEEVSDRRRSPYSYEVIRSNAPQTPEQEMLQKEIDSIWDGRIERLRKVTGRFPPAIVHLWRDGKKPQEISQETKTPPSTVYRILKEMERAVYAEFGADPDAK